MRTFFLILGMPHLSSTQMMVILALAAASAFALAWIADAILGDEAFGVTMNTAVMIAGVVLGMMLWRNAGFNIGIGQLGSSVAVAALSGIIALLSCSIMRRWI
jgi:UPF0716 family protein affecting phage T7 exclusion